MNCEGIVTHNIQTLRQAVTEFWCATEVCLYTTTHTLNVFLLTRIKDQMVLFTQSNWDYHINYRYWLPDLLVHVWPTSEYFRSNLGWELQFNTECRVKCHLVLAIWYFAGWKNYANVNIRFNRVFPKFCKVWPTSKHLLWKYKFAGRTQMDQFCSIWQKILCLNNSNNF